MAQVTSKPSSKPASTPAAPTGCVKEALLYESRPNGRTHCHVCPRLCRIPEGGRGYCGTRVNRGGRLFTVIYGLCSSVALDPIEKKPLFHFFPGTQVLSLGTLGCNLRCRHCQNWQIAHVKPTFEIRETTDAQNSGYSMLSPSDAVKLAQRYRAAGIAWTYNEPTIWLEYALDGARLAKAAGLYTAFVTNGYITPEALDLIGPYLDAYRVDFKGFTSELYRKLARVPDMAPILAAAERAHKKWKMHVEVITNVIPTMNDDDGQLTEIARWVVEHLGDMTPWHVTRFIPHLDLSHLPPTPVETLERAREIGLAQGLKFVYLGNVPGHPAENTYCYRCGTEVIRRSGYETAILEVRQGTCGSCGADLGIRGGAA